MSSRDLSDLCPELQEICEEFITQCADYKIDVLIYCTYRSNEEQDELYASSRPPLKGKWKTDKKGGESKHNCVDEDGNPAACAFDCVPTRGGIAQWRDLVTYAKMGEIGRGLGLTWGGDWKNKDMPHFQLKS